MRIYIICLGAALIALGCLEFFMPDKSFAFWKKWVSHKLFPLHGLLLIVLGFPVTIFRDTLMGKIMCVIGVIAVFSGPFVLLFPAKVKELFLIAADEIDQADIQSVVWMDAFMRAGVGIFFIVAMIFHN